MEKIGIDIADTIIDVWPQLMHKAKEFNAEHSNNLPSKEKYLYLPEDIYGWSAEEKKDFWEIYGQTITFTSPIKKGVKETLKYFKELDYLIYFITAKTDDTYIDLENNIIKLMKNNDLLYDEIYTQISDKGKFCFEHNINYLIDDSFNNCLKATSYGITSLLISNTYNIGRIMEKNMYRINEFEEAKKYIRKKKVINEQSTFFSGPPRNW